MKYSAGGSPFSALVTSAAYDGCCALYGVTPVTLPPKASYARRNSASMLTPKSLLTWMIASAFMLLSIAYFAAAVPCNASLVIVRKNQPPLLPSLPSLVRVGEVDAGEICTTPAGPVTDVTTGIDTELMMPPMIAGTFFRSTSWRAWSTATVPWLCESRRSNASRQPATPPVPAALFNSLNASSTDFDAAWPKRPAAPVSSTTTPIVCAHDGACAAAC